MRSWRAHQIALAGAVALSGLTAAATFAHARPAGPPSAAPPPSAPAIRPSATVAAASPTTPAFQPPRFTRSQMESSLAGAPGFLFIYGTRQPASSAALRARAVAMARHLFDRDSSAVIADIDAAPESVASRSLVLFGGPAENLWTRRLAPALPVSFTARGFRWYGRDYERPLDAIHLVYPNPCAPQRFVLLLAANSADAISGRGGFYFGEQDWRIVRDGELARSGAFAQSPAHPWRYDPALDRDRELERERFTATLVQHRGVGVEIAAPADLKEAGAWTSAAAALLAKLDAMGLGAPAKSRLLVTAYRSLEQKGVLARNTRPEHLERDGSGALALPAGRLEPDLWSVAALRLARLGAVVSSPYLEPAGAWLAGRLEGEPLERSIARLYFARLLPTAREAAARGSRWRSPLLLIPSRALLERTIWECAPGRERAALLATLGGSVPGTLDSLCRLAGVSDARVEQRYGTLVDSLARAGRKSQIASAPSAWRPADGFQRGICLAHAVSLEQGYLSESCARELSAIRALGANWVSITPFGYLPASGTPEIESSADGGVDEETDEAVCEAAARARSLGLRVMLKPHLWTRGWTGALDFGTAGWPRFFERYRVFLLHYAVLAERERMDALVVGHELGTASLAFPDRWRALIGEVRRVYDGTVTYDANWDREADGISFWNACDVIGVSFYSPLASARGASSPAMTAAAQKALASLKALSIRTGRPVLLTEAGYASVSDAAIRPWSEPHGGAADPEAQRACFEALMRAIDGEDWLAGVHIWKWFTAPGPMGSADRSFSPSGKPAQAVIGHAFTEWRDRPVRALPSPAR
ncbi:MAG: hypothetical protein HYR73_01170 [Candidatus Eisenbacteria bacterium]|nr:hypothetical protein [Candidatus Eisenbacteria bacterium]